MFVHLGHDAGDTAPTADSVNQRMWASPRFIGVFDQQLNTDIGHKLFPKADASAPAPQQLPQEGFGYQYYVGDYHPPISGYLLLLLALLLIAHLETAKPPAGKNCCKACWP